VSRQKGRVTPGMQSALSRDSVPIRQPSLLRAAGWDALAGTANCSIQRAVQKNRVFFKGCWRRMLGKENRWLRRLAFTLFENQLIREVVLTWSTAGVNVRSWKPCTPSLEHSQARSSVLDLARTASTFRETEMNEQEWLTCDDPRPMLEFLRANLSNPFESLFDKTDSRNERPRGLLSWKAAQRKLRLFACACVRRTKVIASPDRLCALWISEQYADGLVDKAALEAAFVPVKKLPEPIPCDADMALSVFGPTDMAWEAKLIELLLSLGPELDVRSAATKAAEIVTQREGAESLSRRGREETRQQANVLRDIFGNPFRPVHFDTSRLTARIRSLAKAIYEEGRFADLPALAQALEQDAVCANRDLLHHCQWPIPHVRGCWVVDLVLEKS
jgi:hypothetical protein